MTKQDFLKKYQDALSSIHAPGGNGCHTDILSVANYGMLAGLSAEMIFNDIKRSIPRGSRSVTDREIMDAVNRAVSDHCKDKKGIYMPRSAPVVKDGSAALRKIISQGKISDEADLFEASPIRLWNDPWNDAILFLRTMYRPDDLIWIGGPYDEGVLGKTIRTRDEWIIYFEEGGATAEHIIINPLNGLPGKKENGDGTTLRGNGNVASYRYCLVEFDTLAISEQILFWSASHLPVIALVHSGGKSIHAVLDVQKLFDEQIATSEQWQKHIKGHLYDRMLKPLGVDGSCSTPAHLSRLPGHYRVEKKGYQRILWLSPEGRSICL